MKESPSCYFSSSSFLISLNPWFFFLATVTFGFLLFCSLLPILSFITNILRPNHITTGCDYLILLLVLLSIICSFHNQNNNNNNSDDDPKSNQETTSSIHPQTSIHPQIPKWLDQYTERRIYNENYQILVEENTLSNHKMIGRLRSSISSPDLRQDEWVSISDCWQFSDDIDLKNTGRRRLDHHRHHHPHLTGEEKGHGDAMLDKFIVHTRYDQSSAHPLPAPSPLMKKKVGRTLQKEGKEDGELDKEKENQQPPVQTLRPLETEKKVGRTLHKVGKEDGESDKEKENQQLLVLTPPTPPPPPPCLHESEKKSGRVKDIASALAHLYKKKNKNNYDHALCTPLSTSHPAAPPLLLPRPPRHSSSVFYNLFKKSSKSKRIRSLAPLLPPPFPEAQISLLDSMKVWE